MLIIRVITQPPTYMTTGVHATAVTAGQSMPAGQLSVHTMASCYNYCAYSLPSQ